MGKFLFVEKRIRNEKLGLMTLAAVLKANGHDVQLIQTQFEDIDQYIIDFSPDFLGYSLMTGDHDFFLDLNRKLKKKHSFSSVFGGPHCTFFPEIIAENGVDFVVQGAGEEIICQIVTNTLMPGLYKGNLSENTNLLPHPDRDIIYKYNNFRENPIKNIITMRDCPYNCSYCYNHLWNKFYKNQKNKLFQRRSVENVINEIEKIRTHYPLEKINFIDDNFIFDRAWIKEFCQTYKKKIGLPFLISVRINLLNDDLVASLYDAGLEMVNFALESATPAVQKDLLNRGNFSNESVKQSIALFKKYGIRVRMQNMIGLPLPDPLKDALSTLKFNLENQVEDSWVSLYQPYPRTKLGIFCEDQGYISGSCLENCSDSFFNETRLDIPDKEKLYRLQKWWYLIVRYNLPQELIDILIHLPINKRQAEHLLNLRFEMSKKHFYGLKND